MNTIDFGKKDNPEFAFMSNFYFFEQITNGLTFKTNEHWYQMNKSLDPVYQKAILKCKHPAETKLFAKLFVEKDRSSIISKLLEKNLIALNDIKHWNEVELNPVFHDIKIDIMMEGLRTKFLPDNIMGKYLLMTEDLELREWAPWDEYWGLGKNGNGQNHLGKLLMKRRTELKC